MRVIKWKEGNRLWGITCCDPIVLISGYGQLSGSNSSLYGRWVRTPHGVQRSPIAVAEQEVPN
jgi:hypothetical protein